MWFLFASSLGLQSKARYLKALQALLYEIKVWLCSYHKSYDTLLLPHPSMVKFIW